MNNEQLTAYLKDESYLYTLSYEELKTLVVQYPYASNLRVLLLKKSYIEQNKDYDRNLQMAASYSTNRRFLYKLVKKLKTLQNVPENVILGEDYLELTELSNIEKMLEERHVSEIYNDRKDTVVSDFQLDWGGGELQTSVESAIEDAPIIDLTSPFPAISDSYFTDENTEDFDNDTVDLAIEHILSEFGTDALDFTDVNGDENIDIVTSTVESETKNVDIEEHQLGQVDENSFTPTLDSLFVADQIEEKSTDKDDISDIFITDNSDDEMNDVSENLNTHEVLDFDNLDNINNISDVDEIENQIIEAELQLYEHLNDTPELTYHVLPTEDLYDEEEPNKVRNGFDQAMPKDFVETFPENMMEGTPPQYTASELTSESTLENEMKKKTDVEVEIVNQDKAKIVESSHSEILDAPKLSFKDWLRQFKMTPADVAATKTPPTEAKAIVKPIKTVPTMTQKSHGHGDSKHVLDDSVLAFMFESPNDIPDNLFGLDSTSVSKKSDYFEDMEEDMTEAELPKKKKKKKHMHELAVKSLEENDDMISETLADILSWQGNYKKSIEMYEKLCLLIPEKSDYFAAKIEKLRSNDLMNDF